MNPIGGYGQLQICWAEIYFQIYKCPTEKPFRYPET